MRKNEYSATPQKTGLGRSSRRVLHYGMALIALPLLQIVKLLWEENALTYATAAYYGGMIEHVVAAIALLTAGAYLLEYIERHGIR